MQVRERLMPFRALPHASGKNHRGGEEPHRRRWDTPTQLRCARAGLVLVCLLSGAANVYGARDRQDIANEIDSRTEPLTADSIEVYRTMADADATVASEFVKGGLISEEARERYDENIVRSAASLASAGAQAGGKDLSANRIADITTQLPFYTGLVEQARAHKSLGSAAASKHLRQASDQLQSTILHQAEALQRDQSERLDDQYQRARSVPKAILTLGLMTIAALLLVQVLVFRETKRVFNIGLVASTGALVIALLWLVVALSVAQRDLERSQRHNQMFTDALGLAQIATLQARASELLGLQAPDGTSYENDFLARMQRLARDDGAGGALGAARKFASGPASHVRVDQALAATRAWRSAHKEIQELKDAGQLPEAVASAVDDNRAGAGRAFNQLEAILTRSIAAERSEFRSEIDTAQARLTGLVPGLAFLALASAAGVALGLGQRIAEYR